MLLEHLNKSDKESLVNEVITLFEKFENVKEFYKAELSSSTNPILERYKKKIAEAYKKKNPKERSTNMNINKLITDFAKVNLFIDELIELNLYRVECGIEAISKNKNRTETFYNSIFKSFEEALKIMVSEKCLNQYTARILSLIENAEESKFNLNERMLKTYKQVV